MHEQERQEAAAKRQQRHNESSGSDLLGDGSGLGDDSSWGSGFPSPMGKVEESALGNGGDRDDDEYDDDTFADDISMEDIEIDEQLEIDNLSDEEFF